MDLSYDLVDKINCESNKAYHGDIHGLNCGKYVAVHYAHALLC